MPCAAIQGSKCRGSKNPTQKKGSQFVGCPFRFIFNCLTRLVGYEAFSTAARIARAAYTDIRCARYSPEA